MLQQCVLSAICFLFISSTSVSILALNEWLLQVGRNSRVSTSSRVECLGLVPSIKGMVVAGRSFRLVFFFSKFQLLVYPTTIQSKVSSCFLGSESDQSLQQIISR